MIFYKDIQSVACYISAQKAPPCGLAQIAYASDNDGFFPLPIYSNNYANCWKYSGPKLKSYIFGDVFFCPSYGYKKRDWGKLPLWPSDYVHYQGRWGGGYPNSPYRITAPPGWLLVSDCSHCVTAGNPTRNHKNGRGTLSGANAIRVDASAAWHDRRELTVIITNHGGTFFFFFLRK